ncbi:hypothetical protein CSA08_05125, partial [Candidatus Gracilibacteria bacterium]
GFIHGLKGKVSNNQGEGKIEKYRKFAMKKKYKGFGPTLLAEALEEECGWGKICPESLRLKMIRWGLWIPKKRNEKVKRKKRERRGKEGMMVQFDGSYHDWLEDGLERCMLLAIDDATSNLKKIKMTKGETLIDMEKYWKEYFEEYGKPQVIYLDCHATYKVNHERDMFDEEMLTRFQRAMGKLGVEIIYSKTPEGKGRVERAFKTLQDRLVKKMRIKNIKTVKDMEKYINEEYIEEHNKKFGKEAKESGDYHLDFTEKDKENYHWYFAKENERTIKRDGTIQYNKKIYQLEKGQKLYKGKKLIVKETTKGEIKIFSGNVELDYYIRKSI